MLVITGPHFIIIYIMSYIPIVNNCLIINGFYVGVFVVNDFRIFENIIVALLLLRATENIFEPRHEKTNVLVSDQVRHKPGCTATEDG